MAQERIYKAMEQGGGSLAFFSGITQWISENHLLLAGLGIIVGMLVGVGGLILSWHYKRVYAQILRNQHVNKISHQE